MSVNDAGEVFGATAYTPGNVARPRVGESKKNAKAECEVGVNSSHWRTASCPLEPLPSLYVPYILRV